MVISRPLNMKTRFFSEFLIIISIIFSICIPTMCTDANMIDRKTTVNKITEKGDIPWRNPTPISTRRTDLGCQPLKESIPYLCFKPYQSYA